MRVVRNLKIRCLIVSFIAISAICYSTDITFSESTKSYKSPLDKLTLYDVEGDSRYEILASDDNGQSVLFDPITLTEIWSKKFFNSPGGYICAGYISNEKYPLGCISDQQGNFVVFYLGTGEIYSQTKLPSPVNTPFSLLKDPTADQYLPVYADSTGAIKILKISNKKIEELAGFAPESKELKLPRIGVTNIPVTIADINSDGKDEIISGTSQGVIQVIFPFENRNRIFFRFPVDSPLNTLIAVDSFSNDGETNIIAGSDNTFHVLQLKGESLSEKTFLKGLGKVHSQIGCTDINNDGQPDIIGTSENTITTYYQMLTQPNNSAFIDASPRPLTTLSPPYTGASIFNTVDNKTRILTFDNGKNAWIWDGVSDGDNAVKYLIPSELSTSFIPCGNITGNNKLEFVFFNPKSKKLILGTIPEHETASQIAYITPGGTFQRNGRWNNAIQEQLHNEIKKVSSDLNSITASLKSDNNDFLIKNLIPSKRTTSSGTKSTGILSTFAMMAITIIILILIGLMFKKMKRNR